MRNLKLRRWVLISIPIALLLTLVISILLVNNKKANLETSTKIETKSENVISLDGIDDKSGSISEQEIIKDFVDFRNKRKLDNTIAYYAEQFHLDANKVVEVARQMTNNYESDEFKNNNTIKPGDGKFSSMEAGIVYFVRYLYRNPILYGTTSAEIGDRGIVTTSNEKVDGHIRLANGLTYEQFLGKIADMYGVNKTLALAIVYEESGIMTSSLFRNSNNMGGLRGGSGWLKFPSLEAGTICYIFTLKNLLDRSGLDSYQQSSVYAISGIYVHGNAAVPSPDWSGKVLNFMNRIENNKVFE